MLGEAFAFPRNRDGAVRELAVGGALVLTSPLVVPGLLLWGYLLAVMNASARGRDRPPAFGGWAGLLADGLKATIVWLFYGLVPLGLAAGPPAGAWYVLGLGGLRALPERAWILLVVVVAVLWLLALVLALHLPAALVATATQGRLGAAFQTGALWAVVSTKQYLVGVVVAVAVLLFGSLLGLVLVPLLLVGFGVLFYVQVAVAYLLGRAVGGAAVTAIRPT